VRTLIWIEGLLILRDLRAFVAGVAMVFLVALSPHLMLTWFGERPDLERELGLAPEVSISGDLGWTVAGPRPLWLSAEAGNATEPEAIVRFWTETGAEAGVHFEVLGILPGARLNEVSDVVKNAAFAERQIRAEALGLVGPWDEKLDVVFLEPPVPSSPLRWPQVPLGAALVLLAAAMGSLSWVMEAMPRARSGGWLESLAVMPLKRGQVVLSWMIVAGGMSLLGASVGLAGHWLGSGVSGQGGMGPRGWLVPFAALLLIPFQMLAFVSATDLRAAVMRSLWVLPGFSVLVALGLGLAASHPGWVPWVPVGGLVVASLGLVGPGGLPLTLGLATLLAGVCAWACVRSLEGRGSEVRAIGQVAERRARGNWAPEAALLVAVGVASVVAWSPGLWGQDIVRVLLTSHLMFYALPALAAPRLLGLPSRELLPRRWTGFTVLGLAALGVGATLGCGILAAALQQSLAPMNPVWTELMSRSLVPLSGFWGLVLLAVLPGICEELLFRGAVLALLRKGMGAPWAVVLQAALFALAHLYGFRFLPTFAVGLATGWLVWRTGSLIPAMLLHILHNGIAARLGEHLTLDLTQGATQAWLALAVVIGLASLGLAGGKVPSAEPWQQSKG
jgi:membrane protease YdiL (CAAX protease family)